MKIQHNEENVAKIRVVAERLRGTCRGLDETLDEEFGDASFDVMDIELLRELDDIVLLCEECGWWNEAHDFDNEDNEQVCSECRGEH